MQRILYECRRDQRNIAEIIDAGKIDRHNKHRKQDACAHPFKSFGMQNTPVYPTHVSAKKMMVPVHTPMLHGSHARPKPDIRRNVLKKTLVLDPAWLRAKIKTRTQVSRERTKSPMDQNKKPVTASTVPEILPTR